MKKILLLFVCLLLTVTVSAAEPEGYLFGLKEGTALTLAEADGVSCISEQAGVYRADSIQDLLEFTSLRNVAYLEPDGYATLFDTEETVTVDISDRWDLELVQADYSRLLGLQGQAIRIGIVDSGVNAAHANLVNATITGASYLDSSGGLTDATGHGTFISGILAGHSTQDTVWTSLCPQAELVSLKCFDSKTGLISDIVQAIYDAVDVYDCQVLNLSFGTTEHYSALKAALQHAVDNGVICVAAVGNKGSTTIYYPAAYDFVIGVGSVDAGSQQSYFSQTNNTVSVAAPGEGLAGLSFEGGFVSGKGTSYACPYVVAAAAMAKQADPEITVEEFQALLEATTVDLGDEGYDTSYGYGLLDLKNLMQSLCFATSASTAAYDLQGLYFQTELVRLMAAGYDETGKMLQCVFIPAPEEASQAITSSFPADTADVKLFLLSGDSLTPQLPPLNWRQEAS